MSHNKNITLICMYGNRPFSKQRFFYIQQISNHDFIYKKKNSQIYLKFHDLQFCRTKFSPKLHPLVKKKEKLRKILKVL